MALSSTSISSTVGDVRLADTQLINPWNQCDDDPGVREAFFHLLDEKLIAQTLAGQFDKHIFESRPLQIDVHQANTRLIDP